MATLAGLIVCGLATWQVVEIWNHGSILAGWKATTQAWLSNPWHWLSNLLNCPFCLSVWVGAAFAVLLMLSEYDRWIMFPAYIFAISRLANLGNDLTYTHCRTPGRDTKTDFEDKNGPATSPNDSH